MEEIKQLPYRKPSRLKSYVTTEQIEKDCNEFLNKVGDILFSGNKYNEKSIKFTRSILDFLLDWDFITWKQFDSLMAIRPNGQYAYVIMKRNYSKKGHYYVNIANNYINVKGSLSFTYIGKCEQIIDGIMNANCDRDLDRIYTKIFGHQPIFDETINEGFELAYDREGNRFFAFPEI